MTPYQYRLFASPRQMFRDNDGVAPSLRQIAVGWGIEGHAAARRHIVAMEHAGLIRRLPHRARAIEINRFCTVQKDGRGDDQVVGCAA